MENSVVGYLNTKILFQAEKIIHDAGDRFSMVIERWVRGGGVGWGGDEMNAKMVEAEGKGQ